MDLLYGQAQQGGGLAAFLQFILINNQNTSY